MIKVLLVDDQASVIDTLRMRLELEPDICIVGTAKDAGSAVQQTLTLQPDVIVMDIMMPHCDGISTIELIHDQTRRQNIVVLSMDDGRVTRKRAAKAGARAFIFKGTDSAFLLDAIRKVALEFAVSPTLTGHADLIRLEL